jgi:recombination protein RecR
MFSFPPALQGLIVELTKLPSIGEKSAQRLAYHLVNNDRNLAKGLIAALEHAVEHVHLCQRCFFLSEQELCSICRNDSRDTSLLCIVEKPIDLIAIERLGDFHGYYHVLHGLWAPLRGQGPENMRLVELVNRVKQGGIEEVILAMAATVEGDATALYLARLLGELGVRTTRLAQGLPKGGELEFADDLTLSRAFSGRSEVRM